MKNILFALGAFGLVVAVSAEAKAVKQSYVPNDLTIESRESDAGESHSVTLGGEAPRSTFNIDCETDKCAPQQLLAAAQAGNREKAVDVTIKDELVLRHHNAHLLLQEVIDRGPLANETKQEWLARVQGHEGAVDLALKNLTASIVRQTGFFGGNVVQAVSTATTLKLTFYKATKNENGKLVLTRTATLVLNFEFRRGQVTGVKGLLILE